MIGVGEYRHLCMRILPRFALPYSLSPSSGRFKQAIGANSFSPIARVSSAVPELGPREVYLIVVLAFHVGLIVLLGWARPTSRFLTGLMVLLSLGTIGTGFELSFRLAWLSPQTWDWIPSGAIDPAIVLTIAFLLSLYPVPISGSRGTKLLTRVWLGGMIAAAALALAFRNDPTTLEWVKTGTHTLPFVLAGGLFAGRFVRTWVTLAPGPLRSQALLVGAGFGLGLFRTGLNNTWSVLAGEPRRGSNMVQAYALATLLLLLAAVLVGLLWSFSKSSRWDTLAFAGLLLLGPLVVVQDRLRGGDLGEFATQALRPMLLATAVLRYGLFQIPAGVRRVTFPAVAVSFAVILFLTVARLVSGADPEPTTDVTTSAVALSLIGLAVILFRRPLSLSVAGPAIREDFVARIDAYRIALETARQSSDPVEADRKLARARKDLGVSPQEHDILSAVLTRHLLVPTQALREAENGAVIAGYRVERELGRGGFGRALLARNEAAGQPVVLKEVLRPWEEGAEERKRSLAREAEIGSRLKHPQLARVHGLVTQDLKTFLLREYVAGETLAERIARSGPLALQEARQVALDICAGLQALHEAGLLHLDLKPENVVLTPEGRAVLIDFGTARRSRPRIDGTLTQAAPPAGTLLWSAPEQVLGEPPDQRPDVFALGRRLHFCLTGRSHLSNSDSSPFVIQEEIVHGVYAPSRRLGALGAACRAALARRPEDRPRDAPAFERWLRRPRGMARPT